MVTVDQDPDLVWLATNLPVQELRTLDRVDPALSRLVSRDLRGQLKSLTESVINGTQYGQVFSHDGVDPHVQAYVNDVTDARTALEDTGMRVTAVTDTEGWQVVAGYLPVSSIPQAAQLSGMRALMASERGQTNAMGAASNQWEALSLANQIRNILPSIDGSGIDVGIISDSFDQVGRGIDDSQRTGDLPSDARINLLDDGPSGGTDEGRAMAELVYDVAPGVNFLFHSGGNSASDMKKAFEELRANGADIIAEDVTFLTQPVFQDGKIAQAIDRVYLDHDVLVFSSAGNYEDRCYRNEWQDGDSNDIYNFNPSDETLTITLGAGETYKAALHWSEAWESVDIDIDIEVWNNSCNSKLADSDVNNRRTDQSCDLVSFTNTGAATRTYHVCFRHERGTISSDLKLQLISKGGSYVASESYTNDAPSVPGNHAAAYAFTMGAAYYEYPNTIASYSSGGRNLILFSDTGTPLSSPTVRYKPDFVAAHGVDTTFFGSSDPDTTGFPNFFGTSAASPNGAAIAALALQAAGGPGSLTYSELSGSIFAETAVGPGAGAWDRSWGEGRIDGLGTVLVAHGMPSAERFAELNPFGDWSLDTTLTGDTDIDTVLFAQDNDGSTTVRVVDDAGTTMDPAALLWAYDWPNFMAIDRDGGVDNNAVLAEDLQSFAPYLVEVVTQAPIGTSVDEGYTIKIDGPDQNISDVSLDTYGDRTREGTIGDWDADYFRLVAPESAYGLSITLSPDAGLDGVLTLYNSDGDKLGSADSANAGGDASITLDRVVGGRTYYVRVGADSYATTGEYDLDIDFAVALISERTYADGEVVWFHEGISPDAQYHTWPVLFQERHWEAYIGDPRDPVHFTDVADTFYVSVPDGWGGDYTFRAARVDGDVDPVLALYDADTGEMLGFNDDLNYRTDLAELTETLDAGKRYIVAVGDDDRNGTGDVTLKVDAPVSGTARALTIDSSGQASASSVPLTDELESCFFELVAPNAADGELEVIATPTTLDGSTSTLDADVVLFDASGNVLSRAISEEVASTETVSYDGVMPGQSYYLTVLPRDYACSGYFDLDVQFGMQSISGTVYHDLDRDRIWDAGSGEPGLPGWIVYLDENGNDRLDIGRAVEPDDYAEGTVLNTVFPLVTLTAVGSDVTTDEVTAMTNPFASTGTMGFANDMFGGGSGPWSEGGAELQVDFATGVDTVSIDFVSDSSREDIGQLKAYDRSGNPLDTYTTASLESGEVETMTVSSSSGEIAQVRAYGLGSDVGRLDNLVFGTNTPELFALSDHTGAYTIAGVPEGDHTVREVQRHAWSQTAPPEGEHEVTIDVSDPHAVGVDFGNVRLAEINGVKWHDLNGNSQRDPGEPGVEGWTVYLDFDEDGQLDPGEPSTVTNEHGVYQFRGLAPGTYTVAEVPQPLWEQTFPCDLYYLYDQVPFRHLVTVTQGGWVADLPVPGPPIGGIAYDSDVGTLYGIGGLGSLLQLYEIDPSTGTASPGRTLGAGMDGGLVSNPLDGLLYTVTPGGELVQVDPLSPGTASVVSGPGPGGATAMAFNPHDERIYVYWEDHSGVAQIYSYDAITFAGPIIHEAPTVSGAAVSGFLGMTYNGETLVLSQGPAPDENIYSYDPITGVAAPLFATDLLDARDVRAMTCAVSDGTHRVTVDYGDRVRRVDFGNWRTVGDIHGSKWEDLDADGVRDGTLAAGDDADVVFAIDVSTSVDGLFDGTAVGDVNRDGTEDTVLDAELAALIAFNEIISDTLADVAVVIYGSNGVQMDMDPSTSATELSTTPAADNNHNGERDVDDVLRSVQVEGYVGGSGTAGGRSHFDDSLATVVDTFNDLGTLSGNGTLIFVSDGRHNGGAYDAMVRDLEGMGIDIYAFGVGFDSSLEDLLEIDENAIRIGSSEEFVQSLVERLIVDTEPGLPNWTILLDMNGNGQRDEETETFDSGTVALTIPDPGTVTHSLNVAGMDGLITDVTVTLNIAHGLRGDLEVSLVSPTGTRVELLRDVGGVSSNFNGTILDDEAATAITDGTAPFTGSFRPVGCLADLDGELPNGDWTLEVTDLDSMTLSGVSGGSLESWSLLIDSAEPITTTDADGDYCFTDLPPGTYEVTEWIPPGWVQTYPGEPDFVHPVVLNRADVITDVDFGNAWRPLSHSSTVVDRHIFYNNSYFDRFDPVPNMQDDGAIAAEPNSASDPALGKTALLPGAGTATFQNYTSYWRGINGIMVDIKNLPDPVGLSDVDFEFRVSNRNNRPANNTDDPSTWAMAPRPTISVREDAGTGGSDRVTLIWDDMVIHNQWLQVTVKANATTGLATDDVFYYGSAIGECGDAPGFTFVDGTDFAGTRDNTRDSKNRTPIHDRFDYNRDSVVDKADLAIARDNHTNFLTCLTLFTAPPLGRWASSSSSNSSSSPTVQLSEVTSLAEREVGTAVAISSSGWPAQSLLNRPYLRPTTRQPVDLPQQRAEDHDPQTVFAVLQTQETDGSAYAPGRASQTTGDRWLNAVDDLFENDDSDLFVW